MFSNESLVEHIGNSTFFNCHSLESFSLPPLVKNIEHTFWGCKNWKSLIIQKDIDYIGESAFRLCKKIHKITYYGIKKPQIHENSFFECKNLKKIHVTESYQGDSFGGIKVKIIPSRV